jgi:pimeloyl-ACP methyl ester carboxylesterase
VHGFSDSYKGVRNTKLKDGFLKSRGDDFNIIMVDWAKGAAAPWYWTAVDNTRICGRGIADFIIRHNIPARLVHCIGHSLGAHTCGFAAKHYFNQKGQKWPRISGLDPAGPWFWGNPPHERLDKTDADFVDCINTDSVYGIQEPNCHKNFYPNGGKTMAGCGMSTIPTYFGRRKRSEHTMTLEEAVWSVQNEEDDNKVVYAINFFPPNDPRFVLFGIDFAELAACSHLRVMHYYEESVHGNCRFTSTPCTNWSDYEKGRCGCDPLYGCSPMGFLADRNPMLGQFFCHTNTKSLFCKG